MTAPDHDDELRARLRGADPAQDLRALTPLARRQAIVAAARPRVTGRGRRRGLLGLAGGAVTAGVGALVVVNALAPTATPTALDFGPAGGPASICGIVTAEALSQREAAFEAVVTASDDATATLEVGEVFAGEIRGEVTVPQSPGAATESDLGPLVIGQVYLIATDGTTVATCGQSGQDAPELRALYDEAF